MSPPWPLPAMKAVSGELPDPDDPGWSYEIKWDGYRTVAHVDGGRLRLQSTRLLDVTAKYPELGGLAGAVRAADAVVDGEVIRFGPDGRPSFSAMQVGGTPAAFLAFDLLWLDGRSLCDRPWTERRALLEATVAPGEHWSVPGTHDDGPALAAAVSAQGLEGVVAKRRESRYLPGRRSPAWRKIKHRRRQELVIGGWTAGAGNRSGTLGAVLVGYYEAGALRYAGAVGTGFDGRLLDALTTAFAGLEVAACPFDPPPPAPVRRTARWVQPVLVAEVAFAEWTHEDVVRQASFLGLRDDKPPAEVVREP